MITSTEPKSNAMLAELQRQREVALEQVVMLCGDLAAANARIAELKAMVDKLPAPESKPLLKEVS